jgi:predicted RNase H-like HicB family nuclease
MSQVTDRPMMTEEKKLASLREVARCACCGNPMIKVPVLECGHCGETVPLRAFCYKTSRGYVAECVDLNLMSQGRTKDEAISSLQEAMFSYLDVVFDGGPTEGLILRLSPLSHRIRYHLHDWYHSARGFLKRGGRHRHLMPKSESNQGHQRLCHC